ncbi:MAG: DUF4150 domain-containing protein [Candidatus Aminicenantes bacterium]|nr:DUF4150 domain-containing protein [Candidatus Aminicenantes bacterium]
MKSKGGPKVRAAVAVAVLIVILGPEAAGDAQARRATEQRVTAAKHPDIQKIEKALAAPIPYPNIAMAKDAAAGSKTAKMAGQAGLIHKESDLARSEGDEVGTAVKKLDTDVGKILSGRPLSREEQRAYRQDWTELIEKARGILRGLDQNVVEIEELLKEAEKELGIKRRQPSCSMERRRERECYSVFRC